MGKTVLYLAMSVDGYIADEQGGVDWLGGDGSQPDAPGSYPSFYERFKIETIAHLVALPNVSDFGRPLCQKVAINSLSGYVLCADDDIAIANVPAPTQTEIDEIRSYLTGGFYWE